MKLYYQKYGVCIYRVEAVERYSYSTLEGLALHAGEGVK